MRAFQVRDMAAGTEFIRSDTWEGRFLASAVCPDGSPAAGSESAYGLREAYATNEVLTQAGDQANQWILDYFSLNALPISPSRLTLAHESTLRIDPLDGSKVRVSGLAKPIPDDYCATATYRWAAGSGMTLDAALGQERATLARLLATASNPI